MIAITFCNICYGQAPDGDDGNPGGGAKVLSGIVAFLSTVALLMLICMPSRKN